MNISVIGTGYVGLVSGACLSEFGHHVICLDIDEKKINSLLKGIIPIYESGLEELVKKNHAAGRLIFTNDYKNAVEESTIIFIAVGTPPHEDGSADLKHFFSAANTIASYMNNYKIIVNKSTVPIGTGQKTKEIIKNILSNRKCEFSFDLVSNPEFLREGAAINDFMHPDRIVLGCDSSTAQDIMQELYRVLYLNNHPFVITNIETAELIKYASNAFLATKISFINEISRLCEKVGADVQHVAKAMGLDNRIGKYFLHAGPGYGGSCFPKDTAALLNIAKSKGIELSIVNSTIQANEKQKIHMVDKIINKMGDINNKTIAILGLSFKPETDDMREAPSITIVNELVKHGAKIRVYDPIAMDNAKKYAFLNLNIEYCKDEYDAISKADAIVLLTEWNRFRSLNLHKTESKKVFFFDFRNVYTPDILEKKGFFYVGIGK